MASHRQLVEAAYRWVLKNASCGVAFKELVTYSIEIPDVIGFGRGRSVLIECKTSKADFNADRKKRHRAQSEVYRPMGMYRFYACVPGVIPIAELPPNWGLLHFHKTKMVSVHNPYSPKGGIWSGGFEPNLESEMGMMYSALRRLHLRGRMDEIYRSPAAVKPHGSLVATVFGEYD